MGENSKIEWTLFAPATISAPMAAAADCLHVQPMLTRITAMMVVFLGVPAAIEAWQGFNDGETPHLDSIIYCVSGLACRIIQGTFWETGFSIALKTRCREPVRPLFVNTEGRTQFPRATLPTKFFSICYAPLVFKK